LQRKQRGTILPPYRGRGTRTNGATVERRKIAQKERKTMKTPQFQDVSVSNPKLHTLFVKVAVKHLVVIDKCIDNLLQFSSIHMLGFVEAINHERNVLTRDNAAYADASEILQSITEVK
jgi:hypothetical protein